MGSGVGKVLSVVGMVVGIAALALTGVGLVIGPVALAGLTATLGGVTAAMLGTAAAVLSIGGSLLSPRPKPPSLGAGTLDRLSTTLDPNTPRKAVFGNTAMANDLRDQEVVDSTVDDSATVHRWIVMAAHKIAGLDEIWFDDEKVWTAGGGVGVNATYSGFLTVTVVTEGNSANYINVGSHVTPSARRFTGCAYVYFAFLVNSDSPFSSAIPSRVTLRGRGMPTYDPRKDSTNGGSGTQRPNDNSTWSYDTSGNLQGQNPALGLLSWLLGWRINGKLSVGKGIPAARLDMASFIVAANACDETVTLSIGGSERRYRADGIVSEGDDVMSIVDRWKASMNATLDDVDGKIRLTILVNDLGAPVAAFDEDDVLDEFTWKPTEGLTAAFNIVRGRYVNPSDQSLYQLSEYPEVALTSLDGIDRIETIDFGMVQSQSQAERLAKQRLQRAQYPGMFQANFQFTAYKVQKGDVVSLTFGPLGFLNKLFRVIELEHRGDGRVPLTLREENAAIYAWDNNDSAIVTYAAPIVYSRANTPWQRMITGEWIAPGTESQDANLLKDAQFSTTYWTRTSLFVRRSGRNPFGGSFPIDSVASYVGQVALGSAQSATYDKRSLPRVVVGRLYYVTCGLAKSVGATGTATLRLSITFMNDAGATQGSVFNLDTTLASLPGGGAYQVAVGSAVAPANATKAKVKVEVLANTASGTVRFDNPKLLDKEPGADITLSITGTASDQINYDYTGAAQSGELPQVYVFKLVALSGEVTSGVTWQYKVASGTVNGFTSASGLKSVSGTGYGSFTLSSLGTATADVDIFATYNGKSIGPFRLHLEKLVAAAPSGSTGGSGGTAASQSSGFGSYSTTTFVAVSSLLYTMPTGATTAILSANLTGRPATSGAAGSWTSEGKWQRETSVGSGTWTDVGTVVSDDSTVSDIGTPGEPQNSVTDTAALVKNVNDTGRTAGAQYSYRFVARVSVGGTKSHSVTGTTSVTS